MQGRTTTYRRHRLSHLAVPWLIGLALSLFGAATIVRFEDLLHPCLSLTHSALLAMLGAVALGAYLPRRFARQFTQLTRRYRVRVLGGSLLSRGLQATDRHRGRLTHSPGPEGPGSGQAVTDEQLRVIGAACLVLGGLAILLISPLAGKLGAVYHRALDTFHWTAPTLHVFDCVVIYAYVALPMGLLGIAFNCTQRVALLRSQNLLVVLTSLSVGLSGGLALASLGGPFSAVMSTVISALLLLATGLTQLRPEDPASLVASESADLPKVSGRGRSALVAVLSASGFLITYYILSWHELAMLGGGWSPTPAHVLALSIGLVLSHLRSGESPKSLPVLAVFCTLASATVAGVLALAGYLARGPIAAGPGPVLSATAWMATLAPLVLAGLVVGLAIAAVVERSSRPATGVLSAMLSVCLGAGLGCGVMIFGLLAAFTFFEIHAALALLWLAAGGMLLVGEPQHRSRTIMPHVSLALATLLLLSMVLPTQAPAWSVILQRIAAGSTGALQTLDDPWAADELFGSEVRPQRASHVTYGQPSSPPAQRLPQVRERRRSLDAILVELRLLHEPQSAIILEWPDEPSPCFSEQFQAALIRSVSRKLADDGFFLTRFSSASGAALEVEHFRERVQETFEYTEAILTPANGEAASSHQWQVLARHHPQARPARELANPAVAKGTRLAAP